MSAVEILDLVLGWLVKAIAVFAVGSALVWAFVRGSDDGGDDDF